MNIDQKLNELKIIMESWVDDLAYYAQQDIRQEAANAREHISAMHSFAKRSIAQGRRWFLFNKINGGCK